MPHRATYLFPRNFPVKFEVPDLSSATSSSSLSEFVVDVKQDDNNRVPDQQQSLKLAEYDLEKEKEAYTLCTLSTTKSNAIKGDIAIGNGIIQKVPVQLGEEKDTSNQSGKKEVHDRSVKENPKRHRGYEREVVEIGNTETTGQILDSFQDEMNSETESMKDTLKTLRWIPESYQLLSTMAHRLHCQGIPDLGVGACCDSQAVSYRLWVSGCLSYSDRISDGFYNIAGLNPFLWMMTNEDEEGINIPSLSSLREIEPRDSPMEVVTIDAKEDTRFKELESKALEIASMVEDRVTLAEKLGKLVATSMGGNFAAEGDELYELWKSSSRILKRSRKTIVLPIGTLPVGLCRHRAILFKTLADIVGLPCRIARGCKHCCSSRRSSCLIKVDDDGSSSREFVVDLIAQSGHVYGPDSSINPPCTVPSPIQMSHLRDNEESDHSAEEDNQIHVSETEGFGLSYEDWPLQRGMDWVEIPWDELRIKEVVGAGSFGNVHRAEWHGSDVAVKLIDVKEFDKCQLKQFLREVSIMRHVRHPNLVLFMGATTKPPHFSIVTEFMARGSLYQLFRQPAAREMMDLRKRLRMALDVAKGMNYLHCMNPPIIHSDLKSPNLLVDKHWTVKVCDFGLSSYKASSFISSNKIAGTVEWMAPEFLRGEPSNEKCDVYSFGVILWELVTMQQPWAGFSDPQVVGAVAYQRRRLHIPSNVSPSLRDLMDSCWAENPDDRPSFQFIVDSLKTRLKSGV